ALPAAAGWINPVFAAPPAAGNVTDARVAAETPGDNWLVKGGSFAQQQFSPLQDINDKNVARLGLAWITEMDDPMGLAAEPIVVDGGHSAVGLPGRRPHAQWDLRRAPCGCRQSVHRLQRLG